MDPLRIVLLIAFSQVGAEKVYPFDKVQWAH